MTRCSFIFFSASFLLISELAAASQADDIMITITDQMPGATPFIAQLTLNTSDTSLLKAVQFTIMPKPDSVTRPLSGTYSSDYLTSRGYLQPSTGEIFLPVYGLYDGYTNVVTLTYYFADGSAKQDSTTIATTLFEDPCGYKQPTVLQARTLDTDLSYDYIMVKNRCSAFSPAIIDTDGALRWVGPAGLYNITATFFDNAVYQAADTSLYRLELDGTITLLHDYSDINVTYLHHNIDRGKVGLILDVDTAAYAESTNIEVDSAGNVLKTWDLAAIISQAMVAGGDDPSEFVFPAPGDWFHNNAVTYNRADDSLIISSRENFVICIDYETSAIKWILGDTTKRWHQFPSLAQYTLALAPGSLPPIGQHSTSITYDQNLMVFDNGFFSRSHNPQGINRDYAAARKYQINLDTKVATEVWNYEMDQSIKSPICGSVYEDAPFNYLLDYAFVGGFVAETPYAQLLGLNAAGKKIFYYQYPTVECNKAFNSIPLHLENTRFPTVGPQALNLSTRGTISGGDNALIGGFIVTGTEAKEVVLRALGPSLMSSGLTATLNDPVLNLYDASGVLIATNDDWQSDASAPQLTANGLAPTDPSESAILKALPPNAYTVVVTSKESSPGIGLVEVYDLSPQSSSRLGNISTRGSVGDNDSVLISGFIVGEVANATIVVRALGPSLASSNVSGVLGDPMLTIYDDNGSAIANNDDWPDDVNAVDIQQKGLAPANAAESATVLNLPAGAYSAIVRGAGGGTGVSLVEVYDLD